MLLTLAWIGDTTVVQQFAEWRRNPPVWSDILYLRPEEYSRDAGWELAADDGRRNLYFSECFALRNGASDSYEKFRFLRRRSDRCPLCNSGLVDLIVVDLAAVGIATSQGWSTTVTVPTCEVCTLYGNVYGAIDANGQAIWSTKTPRPEYLPDEADLDFDRLPPNSLEIGELRSEVYAADQFLPVTFSQIGGMPTWIQGEEYPKCPECRETMIFLAQIDRQDIKEYSEGTYYTFVCPDCRTTATGYQQT